MDLNCDYYDDDDYGVLMNVNDDDDPLWTDY